MNLLSGRIVGTGEQTTLQLDDGGGTIRSAVPSRPEDEGAQVKVGIRPEDAVQTDGDDYAFEGKVEISENLGEVTLIYFERTTPDAEPVIAKLAGIHTGVRDRRLRLTSDPAKVHVFKDGVSLRYR